MQQQGLGPIDWWLWQEEEEEAVAD